MKFICQSSALKELSDMSDSDLHSVLIVGPPGCGKTYLAGEYAKMLNILNVQIVQPTVQAIRDAVEECYQVDSPILICVENLDLGVSAASYSLLKFLEEPKHHVYIAVTARNLNRVPDTIISRTVNTTVSPPIDVDIENYAKSKNPQQYSSVSKLAIWRCVKTFQDANTVLNMSSDNLNYFAELDKISTFSDTVSNIVWNLGHYSDNSETPVELVIRYLMGICNRDTVRRAGISCIRDLSSNRIASHAVLAKFVFECKYLE